MRKQYTHLVLSGGGMSGLLYLGALRYLQQEGYDENIRHIAGASIGALFATAFAAGMSMGDLEQKYKDFLHNEEKCKIVHMTMDTLFTIYNNNGIDDGTRMIEPIQDVIGKMTFLELSKKTGKNLVIVATHTCTMLPTYFSVDTTPNVIVLDAVKASMAIPLFVKPVEIGEDTYIDGGVTDGIPVNAFQNVPHDSMLIFHLSHDFNKPKEFAKKPTLFKLLAAMFETYTANYLGIRLLETQYPHYCKFSVRPVAFLPLEWSNSQFCLKISDEKIDESFAVGYKRICEFLELRNVINES
jgi:predicted acylesterase/phospholipase RssA